MSVISTTPQLVNTSEDPGLEYLNQREIEVALTPTENSTKSVVYEEVTQVITNVFQVNAPSGANGQLQFNQNGQYVGDTELQYDPNTDTLTTGSIIANSITITGNASTFKLPGGNNNDVLTTDGTGNLAWANVFPSVSGNTGKFLVTNGVSIDWSSTSYNSLATTTYVSSAIADLVGTAPAMLNTLSEIANVIGQTNDPQYGIISQLANKANISNLAQVAFSGSYSDLSNKPTISTAGTTGNYSDLNGKPTIPTSIMDLGISDGTIGQVLTANGNGTYHFTTVAGGSSYNQDLNTTNNVTFSSVTSSNISSPGNVVINTQNGTFTWNFTSTGALLFPQTPYVTSGIVVNDNTQELSISTDRGSISIWPESSKWLFGANGNLTLPNSGTINDNSGGAGTPGILINRTLHTPDDTDPQNFGEDTITILLDNSEGTQIATYLAQGIGVKVWFNLGFNLGDSYSITSCVNVANGTWTITATGMGDRFSTFETNALIFIYTGSTPNTYTNFPQYVAAGIGATVAITKGNNTWEFGNDGNLTLPAGGDILNSTGSSVLFDGDYTSLTNKPTLFDGAYSSLSGKPTLFDGAYSSLTGKPAIPADVSDLTDTTSLLGGGGASTGNWGFLNDTMHNLSGGEINNGDAVSGSTSGLLLPSNGNTTVSASLFNYYGNIQLQVANLGNSPIITSWEFSSDGKLTLPAGGDIVDITGNSVLGGGSATDNISSGSYNVTVGTDGVISMATARGGIEFGAMPEIGGPTHLHIMRPAGQNSSTDLFFGDDYNYVRLSGQYGIDPNYQQGVEIGSSLNEGSVSVWRFGTDGNLTLPTGGQIIVSGGLVSSGASPAPEINGFSINNSVGITGSGNIAGNNISATGNISGGNISTAGNISGNTNGFTIGYLNIPQLAASNATLALSDAGKHYYSTTAGNFTLTIPTNATTGFETGTAISIVVQAAGNILVNAVSGVTLYMAGNSTAANRVVGGYGMATLMKVATDTWFINGTGVS